MKNKLQIELVPSTSWFKDVKSTVPKIVWDDIKKQRFKRAEGKCEICGDSVDSQCRKLKLKCTELWGFNDEMKTQILFSVIAVCPNCYKVKNFGRITKKSDLFLVVRQLMKVNGMSISEAVSHIRESVYKCTERESYDFDKDFGILNDYNF
jgi:hypothetical protein